MKLKSSDGIEIDITSVIFCLYQCKKDLQVKFAKLNKMPFDAFSLSEEEEKLNKSLFIRSWIKRIDKSLEELKKLPEGLKICRDWENTGSSD